MVAKRARCCASGPRRLQWPRGRARAVCNASLREFSSHTCWCRRARPIYAASSRRCSLLRVAGVLRGPRAAFRAMAMLDAASYVLLAGLLVRPVVATLFTLRFLIRARSTAQKRKDPHSGDVWDSRSTHLQGGHHGNAPETANAGARRYTAIVQAIVTREVAGGKRGRALL